MIDKPNSLFKMEYPFEEMALKELFLNEIPNSEVVVDTPSLTTVFGQPLAMPMVEGDLPYIYSSLVTSIDGRIAFKDKPEGPFIASMNRLDTTGATVDWWILNLLRSSADAIMFGAHTLVAEPDATGHVYDQELEDARVTRGQNRVPWNIIPTLDGKDIPYDHKLFSCGEVPVMIYTSRDALETVFTNYKGELKVLDADALDVDSLEGNQAYVLVSDTDGRLDNVKGMKALKQLGIFRLLCESPTVLHILIQQQLVNELFFNYSCVYLGGDSLTIGQSGQAFTTEVHPHTEILSLHIHSPSFMYIRHKLIYNK